jgi:hypothetical protein
MPIGPKGDKLCIASFLLSNHILYKRNMILALRLISHTQGKCGDRHITKAEYDVRGKQIKSLLTKVFHELGIKHPRVSYFMHTDFVRNPDRVMYVTFRLPKRFLNERTVEYKIAIALECLGFSRAFSCKAAIPVGYHSLSTRS